MHKLRGIDIPIENKIQYNYIHDISQEIDDQGGIYVFSIRFNKPPSNSNMLIKGNYLSNIGRSKFAWVNPIGAIYLDEGSTGNIIQNNVTRNVSNWLHLNDYAGTLPSQQTLSGNTDADAAIEANAGIVDPRYTVNRPTASKPVPMFAAPSASHVWPFSRSAIDIVGGMNGTLNGNPSFDRQDYKVGQGALALDGHTQSVSLGALSLGDAFTLMTWAKLDLAAFGRQVLFDNGHFRVAVDQGEVRVASSDNDGNSHEVSTENAHIRPGVWSHIALSVDRYNGQLRVLVNGVDVTGGDNFGAPGFDNKAPFTVGQDHDGNAHWFGKINDLRLYPLKLRSLDVQRIVSRVAGGSLRVSGPTAAATLDLRAKTRSAGSDWRQWGDGANLLLGNRKRDGGVFTSLGYLGRPRSILPIHSAATPLAWSEGKPLAAQHGDSHALCIADPGNGFHLTLLADTKPRTLTLIAGVRGVAQLCATLSDNSAPQQFAGSGAPRLGGRGDWQVYTITYRAASANQKLTVNWTLTDAPIGASGWAGIQAAYVTTP